MSSLSHESRSHDPGVGHSIGDPGQAIEAQIAKPRNSRERVRLAKIFVPSRITTSNRMPSTGANEATTISFTDEVSINGQPLDDARTYSGVTNSYFAGVALKGNTTVQDTGKARLDVLISYIRQKGTVRPAYDGRRVVVGDSDR